ncbi:hypothetical protein FZEAL_10562 [Fusarium zealandicum]|uniref:Uncharacterized protein n=1 Tax=Fusarium zealandicum TaxID=1053134 RepID=A0A8H4TZZ9_9HYPO|nr:hypothetical protein FZEAL_10562 [Fusarium zealandicum]
MRRPAAAVTLNLIKANCRFRRAGARELSELLVVGRTRKTIQWISHGHTSADIDVDIPCQASSGICPPETSSNHYSHALNVHQHPSQIGVTGALRSRVLAAPLFTAALSSGPFAAELRRITSSRLSLVQSYGEIPQGHLVPLPGFCAGIDVLTA